MDADPATHFGIHRLDALIAADPSAASWSFAEHERGALHEAERIMTLEGADEEIVVAKQRGPRSIVAIHRKRKTQTHADSACPGTADLCRFIRLLQLINTHCPWVGLVRAPRVCSILPINPFPTNRAGQQTVRGERLDPPRTCEQSSQPDRWSAERK